MSIQNIQLNNNHSLNDTYVSKRGLKVEKIQGKDYPKFYEIAQKWTEIAKEKAEQAESGEEFEYFNDSQHYVECIANSLTRIPKYEDLRRTPTGVFVCKDKEDRPQGMMSVFIDDTEVQVSVLATHPRNIRSSVNQNDPKRVEGAGSALIEMSQQLVLDLKKEQVYLFSSDFNKPFYRKMGFEDEGLHSTRMYKTAEKIASEFREHLKTA